MSRGAGHVERAIRTMIAHRPWRLLHSEMLYQAAFGPGSQVQHKSALMVSATADCARARVADLGRPRAPTGVHLRPTPQTCPAGPT
jgi:hypothetical protein